MTIAADPVTAPSSIGPGLRWVVETARRPDAAPGATPFVQGEWLDLDEVRVIVPAGVLGALEEEGQLEREGNSRLRLAVSCMSFNGIVSLLPAEQDDSADHVHLDLDSLWMLRLAMQRSPGGEWAADLGAGNATVTAFLVSRFRRVVGTDLHGPWLRYARMTLDANRGRGRTSALVCCDVASALRPGKFDLALANTPWSPQFPRDDEGRRVVSADGGPTGTEIPARFLRQAAELLAPGGVAVVLALDAIFDGGHRPLLPVLDELRSQGLDVELVPSAVFEERLVTEGLRRRVAGLEAARHVAVIVERACRA